MNLIENRSPLILLRGTCNESIIQLEQENTLYNNVIFQQNVGSEVMIN